MRISDPITFHGMTFTPSANRSWNYMTVRVSDDGDYVQACSQLMLLPSGSALTSSGVMEIQMLKPGIISGLRNRWINMAGTVSFMRIAFDGTATIASMEDASIRMLEDGSIYLEIWIDAVLASYARIMIQVPMSVKCIA